MSLEIGLYEQLINRLVSKKIEELGKDQFIISTTSLDKQEASHYLSMYLTETIRFALNEVKEIDEKIKLSNKIIQLLACELEGLEISENLIQSEGKILQAVFSKLDFPYKDIGKRLQEITPYTRLSQSELFTGNNAGISLESEVKKEILSSDQILWLVSFIKFSGIRIFKEELNEFTKRGGKLKVITTSYMGATDLKAVDLLASLPNTEVKVSYNNQQERLHAKAYLFLRNSGFHTGYIGSSNLSRSALTNGLEWNLKVTTREVGHIINKFQKTFETYWADKEFEYFHQHRDREKLSKSLSSHRQGTEKSLTTFFDLKPYPFQQEILEKLQTQRKVHGRYRNLLVAATGTGKTVLSAFDFKRHLDSKYDAKLLFVAHRKEILLQAQQTFQHILKDANFGELWVDGQEPDNYLHVFASVQTLNTHLADKEIGRDFYDYIIIDEVHHIAAKSYRTVLNRFEPQIILGLTATPERMDGDDILKDFCNVIAAEIRLPEALNRKLLCPFQYFAISDTIDLSQVSWSRGKYEVQELTRVYTENDRRVGDIIMNCEKYLTDTRQVRALGFCVSQEHAQFMAEKFSLSGYRADYLTSVKASERETIRHRLKSKNINFLFVVDIFNEGVDIPEVDTILFLRPTESTTIFLQQFGRGLRLAPDKECLTVLDFVGNARPEYDFEHKFRSLVGKTHTSISKEIEDDFPHLPLGCSIVLEKKAKEVILKNIKASTTLRKAGILQKIQHFRHHSHLPLNLANFIKMNHLDIRYIYKKGSWKRLCAEAGVIDQFQEDVEKDMTRCIGKKLISCNSLSYLKFIEKLINNNFLLSEPNAQEKQMMLMFHYDVWQKAGEKLDLKSLAESMVAISKNPVMIAELEEFLAYAIDRIDIVERDINLNFSFPLKVHSRYNRDQVLAALELHTFEKKSSNREGVAYNRTTNTEALFVTLKKSEKEYSPTTMYDDYALNEYLFHWQSQNSASPKSSKGKSYINQKENDKTILLFVREQNEDEYGVTMSYVFLGKADFMSFSGAKPMNIEWKLYEPIPSFLLQESRKLAVG